MANPEISSTNGASIFINFSSFDFRTVFSLGKKGINLFKKLKCDSHEFIMPSNSNIFLIMKNKSMFSYISDTNVKTSNSMTMYIYHYWYNKQYANELSISYLNSLHFRSEF